MTRPDTRIAGGQAWASASTAPKRPALAIEPSSTVDEVVYVSVFIDAEAVGPSVSLSPEAATEAGLALIERAALLRAHAAATAQAGRDARAAAATQADATAKVRPALPPDRVAFASSWSIGQRCEVDAHDGDGWEPGVVTNVRVEEDEDHPIVVVRPDSGRDLVHVGVLLSNAPQWIRTHPDDLVDAEVVGS